MRFFDYLKQLYNKIFNKKDSNVKAIPGDTSKGSQEPDLKSSAQAAEILEKVDQQIDTTIEGQSLTRDSIESFKIETDSLKASTMELSAIVSKNMPQLLGSVNLVDRLDSKIDEKIQTAMKYYDPSLLSKKNGDMNLTSLMVGFKTKKGKKDEAFKVYDGGIDDDGNYVVIIETEKQLERVTFDKQGNQLRQVDFSKDEDGSFTSTDKNGTFHFSGKPCLQDVERTQKATDELYEELENPSFSEEETQKLQEDGFPIGNFNREDYDIAGHGRNERMQSTSATLYGFNKDANLEDGPDFIGLNYKEEGSDKGNIKMYYKDPKTQDYVHFSRDKEGKLVEERKSYDEVCKEAGKFLGNQSSIKFKMDMLQVAGNNRNAKKQKSRPAPSQSQTKETEDKLREVKRNNVDSRNKVVEEESDQKLPWDNLRRHYM